jgi:hypothetical protein
MHIFQEEEEEQLLPAATTCWACWAPSIQIILYYYGVCFCRVNEEGMNSNKMRRRGSEVVSGSLLKYMTFSCVFPLTIFYFWSVLFDEIDETKKFIRFLETKGFFNIN